MKQFRDIHRTRFAVLVLFVLLTAGMLLGCEKITVTPNIEHGVTNAATQITLSGATNSPAPTSTSTPSPTPTNTATPTPTPNTVAQPGSYSLYGVDDMPLFSGNNYIITDESGEILMSYNATESILPASTIKILTALTAIEIWGDSEEIMVATSKDLKYKGAAAAYGVKAGMEASFDDWMKMLLICSYGDAADVIAGNCARKLTGNPDASVPEFVEAMNKKAQEIGMTDTYVDNPIGLDVNDGYNEIRTTAADMMKLLRVFMANEKLAYYVSNYEYTTPDMTSTAGTVIKGKKLTSTNYFYVKPETYHSDLFTSIGTKTGSTEHAGYCYTATVVSNSGKTYYFCGFGMDSRPNIFNNTIRLLEYCIQHEN